LGPPVEKLPWENEKLEEWLPLPKYSIAHARKCEPCMGMGTVNEATGFCDACGGTGKNLFASPVEWHNGAISMGFLGLLKDLPNVQICPSREGDDPYHVRFDGGKALVMPIL